MAEPITIPKRATLLKGTSIVASLTLLSRLLGFVRDLIVARIFGASPLADAFYVAFRIPNLLRSLFAEGALSAAFVPVFSEAQTQGPNRALEAWRAALSLLLVATGIVSVLGVIFAEQVVALVAPGFQGEAALCSYLTRLMFPYIMWVSVVALCNGALNAYHVFGASAWAQVAMNLVLILGGIGAAFLEPHHGITILALSVLVGGLIQVLVQVPALRRCGLSFGVSRALFSSTNRQILRLMAPAIVGAMLYQVSIFLNTLLASYLPSGSITWLYYADRVTQLPIGVFSIALASVLLPLLSRASAEKDTSAFSNNLVNALCGTSFVLIPVSAFLALFAQPIVHILFERGAFDAHSTARTAQAVQALALGLWATSSSSMVIRAFMAKKDTRTPTLIGLCSLSFGFVLSLILMGPVEHAPRWLAHVIELRFAFFPGLPSLAHAGLALASSLASFFSLALALYLFGRRASLPLGRFCRTSLQALLSTGVVSALFLGAFSGYSQNIFGLILSLFGCSISYLAVMAFFRSQEALITISLCKRYTLGGDSVRHADPGNTDIHTTVDGTGRDSTEPKKPGGPAA